MAVIFIPKYRKEDDFMATAKKLPSGSWRVQVFSHYEPIKDDTGKPIIDSKTGKQKQKRIYESFTCDDPSTRGRRKVERMAAEWTANKERISRADFTLEEAMAAYVKLKSNILSPTTLRGYETLIRNAYPELLRLRIRTMTNVDVQEWANKYALNHSAKTVSNAHGFLSAVLSVYEPSLHLNTKLPEKQRQELYVPSDSDIKKLLKTIEGTEMEKAVLLAAFGTLRRGEICALTDQDIKGNSIIINKALVRSNSGGMVIKAPKTLSSNRTVEYPQFVIDKFKGIKGPLVQMHPEDISKNFGKILQEAGLPHFRFHDLRHYSASIMHAIGIPDQYIMARGGWKTDNVLKAVYRNVITDEQIKFTTKINTHFEAMQHAMQHEA